MWFCTKVGSWNDFKEAKAMERKTVKGVVTYQQDSSEHQKAGF